jgi:hypothetical protein
MAQINKPSEYFNTKLYTGTGAENALTSVGFQPDLTWIKRREINDHRWFDAVRGATKYIESSSTDAEVTDAQELKSFDSDGFTLGTALKVNASGGTYASWNWLADNTSGSSNTDGSITSTVSANTTSGFSIVQFTGTGANATVGHGLGVTPAMVIVKVTSTSGNNWIVWNKNLSSATDSFLRLSTTAAVATISNFWGISAPNANTFSLGAGGYDNNISSATHIAYCFAEKKGFSKFGSYTGNGNADGTFIYTGFKPAFVIQKHYSGAATEGWQMWDTKRNTYNLTDLNLSADAASAEFTATARAIDILSNGFKCRGADASGNASGQGYIYMAFAEEPLVGTNNIPATAR